MAAEMEAAARAYFAAWNTHSAATVGACFTPTGTLRDWDIEVGPSRDAVAEANGKIFAAVPGIRIEVLHVHVAEAARVATCEILVHVSAETVLKVCDVIAFAPDSLLIAHLRAYKG